MKKPILFFTESQYLKFYAPLAKKLCQSFNPILLLVNHDKSWKSQWPYTCVPLHSLIKTLKQGEKNHTCDNSLIQFEKSFIKNKALFQKSYPYTVNNIASLEDAYSLAHIWVQVAKQVIAHYQPAGVFVWNGRYLPHKAIISACKDLNSALYTNEIGWIPGTIFLDKGELNMTVRSLNNVSIHDGTCTDISLKQATNFLKTYKRNKASMVTKAQKEVNASLLRKKLLGQNQNIMIFYGCQVDWDTNIVIGSSRFSSNKKAISFLVSAIKKIPAIKIIVKPHPLDTIDQTDEIRLALGNHGEIVTNIHAHSLIEASDCVVVRNSTIGFEALCYEKPVILFEKSKYSLKNLVYHPTTKKELEDILLNIASHNNKNLPDKKALLLFISHLLTRYLIPLKYSYFYSKQTLNLHKFFSHTTALKDLISDLRKNQPPRIKNMKSNKKITTFLQTNEKKSWITIEKIKNKIMFLKSYAQKIKRFSIRKISFKPLIFCKTNPQSKVFGLDRGTPIDRYYIEQFLQNNSQYVKGHTLEIGDNTYTKKFGAHRVTKSDVLHLHKDSGATIIANLADAEHIESNQFDSIIFTQTLQFIYEKQKTLKTLHRILKPGGVLLATIPGISQISTYDMERWGDYWRFTTLSTKKMFQEVFDSEKTSIQSYGNVLSAISFLHGLATKEIPKKKLDYHDPNYQLTISIKAIK